MLVQELKRQSSDLQDVRSQLEKVRCEMAMGREISPTAVGKNQPTRSITDLVAKKKQSNGRGMESIDRQI